MKQSAPTACACLLLFAAGIAGNSRAAQQSGVERKSPAPSVSYGDGLDFVPDAGIRVDNASNPAAGVDAAGTVYLYYNDRGINPGREMVATAADGLTFSAGSAISGHAFDSRRTLLPDGTWRLYQWDPRTSTLRSSSSTNGISFTPDPDARYVPQAADRGTLGVYDAFGDGHGGVVLLYLGDLQGLNNVRRAFSLPGDNGWNFSFEASNVLGDAGSGGGANSYVDPKSVSLADGRRRLLVMRQGIIYSFISSDQKTFALEPGIRVKPGDFAGLDVRTLNDPVVIRLPDGRYRMYVAAMVGGSPPEHWVVVSATAPAPAAEAVVQYLPHIAKGQGIQSEIVLTNPQADGSVTSQIQFLDDQGKPMTMNVVGVGPRNGVSLSIPALGTATVSTDSQGEVLSGSAVVQSSASVGAFVRFSIQGLGRAAVAGGQPGNGWIVPARRTAGGVTTAIAVQNVEPTAISIRFSLCDVTGKQVANGVSTIESLAASGHQARFLDELFPKAALDAFEGTLVIQAIGGRAAIAVMELGVQPGQFTTVPLTPR